MNAGIKLLFEHRGNWAICLARAHERQCTEEALAIANYA